MKRMSDLISRKAAIEAITQYLGRIKRDFNQWEGTARIILDHVPSAQPDSCDGCKHKGKWENEVEYGYNSPCTVCKRRVNDNYE